MMDTTERHTRRLWIDPADIGELLEGLAEAGEQQTADVGQKATQLPDLPDLPIASLAPAGDDFVAATKDEVVVTDAPSVSAVSPDLQQRLGERLARIRSLAAHSGTIAGEAAEDPEQQQGLRADGAHVSAVEAEDPEPAPDTGEQQILLGGKDPVAATGGFEASQAAVVPRAAERREDEGQSRGVTEAGPGGGEGSASTQSSESPESAAGLDDTDDNDASRAEKDLARFRERAALLEKDAIEGVRQRIPVPGGGEPALPQEPVASGSGQRAAAEFSPSGGSLWQKFAELAEWIELRYGLSRLVLADEQGAPIELRGIERGRCSAGGDLAVLLQRARRAIGDSETGIHLATAVGEAEYLCVINCPSSEFRVCIGLLTAERISFRSMVAIGNALQRTLE